LLVPLDGSACCCAFQKSGRVPTDLSAQVIGPMLYDYANFPSIPERGQIDMVLEATGRDRSPRGLRDHALLLMLAVYGLREGEICKLRLDDIDWRADSLRTRHIKTNACSCMPMLTPVGDAVLDYLRLGHPQLESRDVFIRSPAPCTRMRNLQGMVEGRLAAAGVTPVMKRGPHVFRQARAVDLLCGSVSQMIIDDGLGHRSTGSTNAYLKLATEDLRAVALPMPGSAVLS
jgi:integrase